MFILPIHGFAQLGESQAGLPEASAERSLASLGMGRSQPMRERGFY